MTFPENLKLGGRLRAQGGAAARRVAFLRKKLRKNLFGKRFFGAQWDRCEHSPPMPEGARPVFADGKDRSSRGLSLRGPFFFGRGYVVVGGWFCKF